MYAYMCIYIYIYMSTYTASGLDYVHLRARASNRSVDAPQQGKNSQKSAF